LTEYDVDAVIASIGLPAHPPPKTMGNNLAETATVFLNGRLERAIKMAAALDSRGWPAATLGDGGSRSTDSTSSTERAGLEPSHAPHSWTMATYLRVIHLATLGLESKVEWLHQHASDRDDIPGGTGNCEACETFCTPTRNPHNRLKAGLCPRCYSAHRDARDEHDRRPNRQEWIVERRKVLTDEQGRIHPPAQKSVPTG
jgi:hypothetical protein